MSNTTDGMFSSGEVREAQTAENTVAPFAALPEAPVVKAPYKRPPRTKAYREARAAERAALGLAKPGRKSASDMAALQSKDDRGNYEDRHTPETRAEVVFSDEGDDLLKALVDKLVALENDSQYVAVWTHFFSVGGVYNGPRYLDELKAAITYLQSIGR
jgi:hypothetical protein